ncbi:two-component system osmolarity sensor histidine kinase EnvZ [Litorimonas taeanensis]|uniref:histidine kinase n=1 Tax=Litorimonas taeanensis TaxID=568099 RepID=A0A420WKM2_9PROT|nr:ATP-binding protein [Litorimonas taeanensis]RKQ71573.1 two-component system osmolarity sensor histidine kinase EnvZ [Litorimonas taeanensis]
MKIGMKGFKRYLPKSLFGRALLIIILPIAVMQIAVAYFFFNAHWARVTANLSDSVAADIAVATTLFKQTPTIERAQDLDSLLRPDMQLSVVFREGETLPVSQRRQMFFSNLDKTLRRSLNESLTDSFWFDTTRYPNHIDVRVEVDGGYLRFIAARERVFAPTGFVFIFWLITATVLLTLVSVIFIRNQARPIRELADAAEAYGKGKTLGTYKPSGASEVRLAGHSFLKMRSRIQRHMEQRTMMLAGVSHDLRTPLTRLKLQLAMQENTEEVRAAKADIVEMENMLNGYLDFARGLEQESPERVHFLSYLKGVSEGKAVDLNQDSIPDNLEIEIRPASFQRALDNLITNSIKYANGASISLALTSTHVEVFIDDSGPGIPKNLRKEAFRAFSRLDSARSQNVEGVGLGLAIARDIAQLHGGTLKLTDSPMGGLRAVISLPR